MTCQFQSRQNNVNHVYFELYTTQKNVSETSSWNTRQLPNEIHNIKIWKKLYNPKFVSTRIPQKKCKTAHPKLSSSKRSIQQLQPLFLLSNYFVTFKLTHFKFPN